MSCDIAINAYFAGIGAGAVVVIWLAERCWSDYRTARAQREAQPTDQDATRKFAERVLNPSDLGYAVTPEVRDAARRALGLPRVETPPARRRA